MAAERVVGFLSPSVAHVPTDVRLMLPPGASVIIATLSNQNGKPGAEERAFAGLDGALDALVLEGAQSAIIFGIPTAARLGYAEDRRLCDELSERKGIPIVSSLWVSLQHLKARGVQHPLATTQYSDVVNADQVNAITPADHGRLARTERTSHPLADGIFLAARGRLLAVAEALEADPGLPVVHHQEAALWWALDAEWST